MQQLFRFYFFNYEVFVSYLSIKRRALGYVHLRDKETLRKCKVTYSRGVARKTDENYGSISINPPDCPRERIISAHICFKLAYN